MRGDRDHSELGDARFDGAQFAGDARFTGAKFGGTARFDRAQFKGRAEFDEVHFKGNTRFDRARFHDEAEFREVQFSGNVRFNRGRFCQRTSFRGAHFLRDARFMGTRFDGDARLEEAYLKTERVLGPVLVEGRLALDETTVDRHLLIEAFTCRFTCIGTEFHQGATIRLRWADVVLDHCIFGQPTTVSFAQLPFRERRGGLTPEGGLGPKLFTNKETAYKRMGQPPPRLLSMRGVDVSNLTLVELDLRRCLFQGAHKRSELRIVGARPFADTPNDRVQFLGMPLWRRWTHRQVLAEEHRRRDGRFKGRWYPPECRSPDWLEDVTGQKVDLLEPDRLASIYRALRKAQEDNKNEPGAADFYYGEMEMRRQPTTEISAWIHRKLLALRNFLTGYERFWRPQRAASRRRTASAAERSPYQGRPAASTATSLDSGSEAIQTPKAERFVLKLYWLISGYSLRGFRTLLALLMLLALATGLITLFGFPPPQPKTTLTATIVGTPPQQSVQVEPEPAATVTTGQPFWKRLRTAAVVALEGAVFRSSEQQLSYTGRVIQDLVRIVGPVLLGLMLLSVRNRVKR
jgi:uncharacterized protein YjbI with pentapeptide repeats